MTDYAFLPNVIELARGERVRVSLRNIGRVEHDFFPEDRGRALGLKHIHLRGEQNSFFDWTAPAEPTELLVVCSVPGHRELGMTARIVVR